MAKWDIAMSAGRILTPTAYRQMWTPVLLKMENQQEPKLGLVFRMASVLYQLQASRFQKWSYKRLQQLDRATS